MAQITLDRLAHSYDPHPKSSADFALKEIDHEWSDGGAYALLGPSGCGKTTLLNIISGLLTPSRGRILFDGEDVTERKPEHRNIEFAHYVADLRLGEHVDVRSAHHQRQLGSGFHLFDGVAGRLDALAGHHGPMIGQHHGAALARQAPHGVANAAQ
jgi:ABC-type branched-subunit amino acid transport system ATPase component